MEEGKGEERMLYEGLRYGKKREEREYGIVG